MSAGALLTIVEREPRPGVRLLRIYVDPDVLAQLLAMIHGRTIAEREMGRTAMRGALAVAERTLADV